MLVWMNEGVGGSVLFPRFLMTVRRSHARHLVGQPVIELDATPADLAGFGHGVRRRDTAGLPADRTCDIGRKLVVFDHHVTGPRSPVGGRYWLATQASTRSR